MGNVLVLLAQRELKSASDRYDKRFQIENNVGEDVHIHYRNVRFELTREEFIEYAEAMTEALARLKENT